MAVTITLTQVRASIVGGYTVTSTITAATNISTKLFLFDYDLSLYQHVCTVDDLYRYPDVRTLGQPYFRAATAILTYTTEQLEDAVDAAALQKTRLAELAPAYNAAVSSFVGSEVTVYSS
jgi:hypothetical protein